MYHSKYPWLLETYTLQYDRTVSINHPPSTTTFNPANCWSSLHTCNQSHHPEPVPTSAPSSVPGIPSDLAHLSQIISSVVSIAHTPSKPPTTPTHHCTPPSASSVHSPTCNTPSKLSQFFEYAETNLSVKNVHLHEESLQMLGFGPDILYLVEDGVLKDVEFTPGDVIHLKQNS